MPLAEVLSALVKPLIISVGKALAPFVKQLRAERKAGGDSPNVNTVLLDSGLEETLSRLQDVEVHSSWLHEVLQRVQTAYVRPEHLAKPSIRDWLRETAVRDDLKALARASLLRGSVDQAPIKARLAERYSHHTGEAVQLAAGPVDTIVNILLAGKIVQASKSDRVVAGIVQESHEQISARFDAIEEKIGALSPDQIITQVNTEKAQAALHSILPRRSIPGVDARAEIAALAARLENEGDLRFCARPVQAQIYLWAARLHAQQKTRLRSHARIGPKQFPLMQKSAQRSSTHG